MDHSMAVVMVFEEEEVVVVVEEASEVIETEMRPTIRPSLVVVVVVVEEEEAEETSTTATMDHQEVDDMKVAEEEDVLGAELVVAKEAEILMTARMAAEIVVDRIEVVEGGDFSKLSLSLYSISSTNYFGLFVFSPLTTV